jgi:hypothetical protein
VQDRPMQAQVLLLQEAAVLQVVLVLAFPAPAA